jgi:mRNA interferase RelE/StbE
MKTITYSPAADRALKKLPVGVRTRIMGKLRAYAESGSGDVKALAGSDLARLRVGDYRIIFIESATEITVGRIGHRREVYR